ncbi:hypothetical protein PPYR_09978 [Photinus pyralis]|uniref:Uncharacterized protein n=1 Tax=Photinus pyralis TaxID=7054 RepID=A0A1Y1JW78_PHOPY|nr:alpha-ketoglutarate-dependent dioxygenase alkB homolog 4 [Photinus pyralis]KAB0795917.1 hypothetical protein PPYR_09978 [Photinus pyralis]
MDKPRPCGCKGCRTCLICEKTYGITSKAFNFDNTSGCYVYCPRCNLAWPGWSPKEQVHPDHHGTPINYPGVYIQENFLSTEEEEDLLHEIDSVPWDLSQSGRRKQNYGPKCNFRQRKLQLGNFDGFPKFSQFVQDKFKDVHLLKDFQTIEQCSLEYDAERGAAIDPHIDDCWIWGERIVTVNLLSDSILTMTANSKPAKYNLDCVATYPSIVTGKPYILDNSTLDYCVRIPMPRRSLLVLYGSPRYDWEHQVLREDITTRRVCLAYREFTPPYLNNPIGKQITDRATIFK